MSAMELDNPAPASTTQNAEPAIAEEVESILNGKIQLLPGYTSDLSAATYCLVQEDHTLGNCIRWMLMKDPRVEFCGYSLPHPSEDKIHLRIQTYDRTSSLLLLHEAIKNLENVFTQVKNTYEEDLSRNEFERYEEEELDMEEIKRQGEENKKRMEKRQREEEREKNRRG